MRRYGLMVVLSALSLAACGGGGGSTPAPVTPAATATPTATPAPTGTPAPTPTPTPTPSPTPTPGPVMLTYASSFANSTTPSNNPPSLSFQAEGQTATVTAAEFNFAGAYTATSSCAAVTVAGTNPFTLTAKAAAASGCTLTVHGFSAQTATVGATVAPPGGTQIRWVGPGYQNQAPPVPLLAGPINLVGVGALFAATLVVSETGYIGTFTTPVPSAGCGASLAVTASAGTGLPASTAGNATAFYTVTASGVITPPIAGCTISTGDVTAVPFSTSQIGVVVTTGSGSFQ
jgi:hypothetical protein